VTAPAGLPNPAALVTAFYNGSRWIGNPAALVTAFYNGSRWIVKSTGSLNDFL
jgi:hypothetical protein